MATIPQLIGVGIAIKAVEQEIDYAARSDAKVLITGESGVGKEVVARIVHQRSARRHAPLVTINCAGIPDTLLASELFGHTRGSFTDAHRDKIGWLEQAHRGTIFLDEIGEMSAQMQALLLRFLESGEIQRVGSDRRTTTVDVRVMTATNRRLIDRVAKQEFREDLFYRLNVIHIEVPPLRHRREDIPALLDHFFKQFSENHQAGHLTLSDAAAMQLYSADWPGNVRQLRNVVERLVVRARNNLITPADLPREILSFTDQMPGPSAPARSGAETAFDQMVQEGESFWTAVYAPFMARDLTRDDVRSVVSRGLQLAPDGYKALMQLFNIPPSDCKRLITFLRKYQCHVPTYETATSAVRVEAEHCVVVPSL